MILPVDPHDAILCACGECGAEPDSWECESRDDPTAVAEAWHGMAILYERAGRMADARRCADRGDATSPFYPYPAARPGPPR